MKKKMKFKGRRYAEGGTPDGEDEPNGPLEGSSAAVLGDSTSLKPATPAAEQSFGQAFKAGRKAMLAGGDKTFMYKGKSYNTNVAEAGDDKASKSARGRDAFARQIDKEIENPTPPTSTLPADYRPTDGPQKRFLGPKKKSLLSLASDRATGYKSQVEETGMTEDERTDALKTAALTATAFLPFGKLVKGFQGIRRTLAARKAAEAATAARATRAARATAKNANPKTSISDVIKRRGIGGYNKGGSVKSSASSRADGIAQRGKTRGRNC